MSQLGQVVCDFLSGSNPHTVISDPDPKYSGIRCISTVTATKVVGYGLMKE